MFGKKGKITVSEETQKILDKYSNVHTLEEYRDFCKEISAMNDKPKAKDESSKGESKSQKEESPKTEEPKTKQPAETIVQDNEAEMQCSAAEAASGLIKPFFNIPVDYENKTKPTFDFEKVKDPVSTMPTMINTMPAASILKGDIVADVFLDRIGVDRTNPVREDIKHVINEGVKEMDSNPNKLDEISANTYIEIAKLLGADTTPKGIKVISGQIKDIYLTATQQPINTMMQQAPVTGPIPVSYSMAKEPCHCSECQPNEKIDSAFKTAKKIAEDNGMSINVVPTNGLYRADVLDSNGLILKDRSFWADLDGKILNRKNKWFPVYVPKTGSSFEDYSMYSFDEENALTGHLLGTGTSGCKLINSPKHIAKNRIIDLISMPNFGTDNETRDAINDILDRSFKANLFKSDAVKTKNRYRIVEANKSKIVMVNDAPIRYGYQVDPNEKHIKLTIRLSDGEASVSDW